MAIITGRADVILDKEGGEVQPLAIVDYTTSTDDEAKDDYELQLAVYADAGLREGLNVRAAYVHDLKDGDHTGRRLTGRHRGNRASRAKERAQPARPGLPRPAWPPMPPLRRAKAVPMGLSGCDARDANPVLIAGKTTIWPKRR
jgi:hypothetical protein